MPTFAYMTRLVRGSVLSALSSLLLLTAVGCGEASTSETPGAPDTSDDEVNSGAALKVYVRIAESKIVFSSRVDSFGVKGAALDLPCRTRAWYLSSKPSLYREGGWSPAKAADFSEDLPDSDLHEYVLATCRDAETNIVGWFAKEREYEFTVPEQLLDEDYKPAQMPLILQQTKLGSDTSTYFSCSGAFQKKLIKETENAKHYDIEMTCRKRAAPSKGELGPIDFMNAPGPYAAVASYKPWALPPVASNKQNFDKVKSALLAQVPAGNYSGAMSTLGKACGLEIIADGDKLLVNHTIKSSNRTRRLVLEPSKLLGFTEGDVFEDPIRVGGEVTGKFAAAEFKDDKGESVVVRFEKNTNLEGQIVRIDGAEAYCRRLAR